MDLAHAQLFTFADPLQLQATMRAGNYEVLARSKGGFDARYVRVDFDRVWMQSYRSSGAFILRSATAPERMPLFFLADANARPIQYNGVEISAQDLVFLRRGDTSHILTEGASEPASISLRPDDFAAASRTVVGREIAAPRETQVVRPDPAVMERLRSLYGVTCQLAKDAPAVLAHPGMARALEDELVRAMVACVAEPQSAKADVAKHRRVITRFEDFLAARRYEPVYLAEICAAIGVSERALRTCCQEHLGMGPIRYLWLRRMHLARRALLGANRETSTVTEVATAHGFWELGRFSVEYRALFGELPSSTLKRPSGSAISRSH